VPIVSAHFRSLFHGGLTQWRSQECELGASPPLPPPSPSLPLSPPLPLFNGGYGGITPEIFFEIKGARR